jgi:hypothetical protein
MFTLLVDACDGGILCQHSGRTMVHNVVLNVVLNQRVWKLLQIEYRRRWGAALSKIGKLDAARPGPEKQSQKNHSAGEIVCTRM